MRHSNSKKFKPTYLTAEEYELVSVFETEEKLCTKNLKDLSNNHTIDIVGSQTLKSLFDALQQMRIIWLLCQVFGIINTHKKKRDEGLLGSAEESLLKSKERL